MPERPSLGCSTSTWSWVQPPTPLANRVTSSGCVTFLVWALCLSTLVFLVDGLEIIPEHSTELVCPSKDEACLKDRFGFEAVRQLHSQIDDDHNGNLDRTESDGFMRDELKYEDGFDRGVNFHGQDDLISVQDLWHLWIHSEVYNWTVDDVIDWVVDCVELPQYAQTFRVNAVDGKTLPRLAANGQYLTNILGIKNAVNKQKLAVKAMDAVLFGAPKTRHSYIKDVALVASLVIAMGGCWLAYLQHRYSQKHLHKVMKDLDTLQKAEDALSEVQFKLDKAQEEQEHVVEEKKQIESILKAEIDSAKGQAEKLRHTREATEEEIARLRLAEEELVQVRRALRRAEKELEERQNAPLAELQQWLQLTHELECKHYNAKREAAEAQLLQCKDMCEKIRRKRGAFLGSLRIAHTTSMDDTDGKILRARAALEEVKTDLQERSHRWQTIEQLCGFNIIHNPGLGYLESSMTGQSRSDSVTGRPLVGSVMTPVEETDEENPSPSSITNPMTLQPPCPSLIPPGSPSVHRRSPSPNHPDMGNNALALDSERRVWPNLMRAGMQLTMFGLGMTNPHLAALQPVGPPIADKRAPPSLLKAFGSSNSLQSMVPSCVNDYQSSLPPVLLSELDAEVEEHNKVTISLGAMPSSASTSTLMSDRSSSDRSASDRSVSDRLMSDSGSDELRQRSFGKSQSLEIKPAVRPKGFPSSVSMPVIQGESTANGKPTQSAGSPGTPTISAGAQDSSPESVDSLNLDDDRKKEKKKKKRLFPKLHSSKKPAAEKLKAS